MSIPDYIITRSIIERTMQQQFQGSPNDDLPEPRRRQRPDRLAAARRRLSAVLHDVANRIEPRSGEPAAGRAG